MVYGQEFSKTQQPYLAVNYIKNAGIESGVTGYSLFNDGASVNPVDGTGGTATITLTSSTTNPLVGTRSLIVTKPSGSSHQGQGFSSDFTIANADRGKVIRSALKYEIASGTYATGDMTLWIYDVTNTKLIQPSAYTIEKSGLQESKFVEWQSSIDSNLYRLIVHISSTSTQAYSLRFDSFEAGNYPKLYGSPITDWVNYVPIISTASGTMTNVTATGKWRRVGDTAEIQFRIVASGSTGTWSSPSISLPSGLSVDTNKKIGLFGASIGNVAFNNTADNTYFNGKAYIATGNTVSIAYSVNANGAASVLNQGSPFTFDSTDNMEGSVTVPIVGWSSSQVLSSDADTRLVSFSGYMNGTVMTANVTNLTLATRKDTHGAWTGSSYVVPVAGDYDIKTLWQASSSSNLNLYVNGAVSRFVNAFSTSGALTAGGGIVENLKAGDVISFRSNASVTSSSGTDYSFSITRISGPSQIAASESVLLRVTQSSGQSIPNTGVGVDLIWNNKIYDSHGSFNLATGEFTAPISGKYKVSSKIRFATITWSSANEASLVLSKNGTTYSVFGDSRAWGTISVEMNVNGDDTISLLAGEKIKVQAINTRSGGSASLSTSSSVNFLTVERVGNY